jgi:hypothetical protein
MISQKAIQDGLKPVEKLYNPLIAKYHLNLISPQFVGMERGTIKGIENRKDRVVIKTEPVKANITLFKGHFPLTHVDLVHRNPRYTILERHPMFVKYQNKLWVVDYSKKMLKAKGKKIPFSKVKWGKAKLRKVV